MRVKLDENVPALAVAVATQLGHDADTVVGENLTGATDADILAAASRDERLLVTLDRGFGDIRMYPPGKHAGVAVLRVESQDTGTVSEAVRSFLMSEDLGDLAGCLVVVRGHLARIRRPQ